MQVKESDPKNVPRIVFAANRTIGLWCLEDLLAAGMCPVALIVPDKAKADRADEMRALVPGVPVLAAQALRTDEGPKLIANLDPDYLISVHYPHLVPRRVLEIPRCGCLNLHPSFLPYNRGWHTPTWAIVEGTPCGATIHWMDEGLDTGPIALQKSLEIRPDDTADSLYGRILLLEREVFREALPLLRCGQLPKTPQPHGGTAHMKSELQRIQDLDRLHVDSPRELIDYLRALTTNRREEAAYFSVGGRKYRVRVEIWEDDSTIDER